MKSILRNTIILLSVLLVFSCEDDPTSNEKSNVVEMKFGYSNVTQGRNKVVDKTPAAIVITIEDASSTVIHQSLKLPVQNFNGNIVTQPLALEAGTYTITEYKVLNSIDSVIYATPLEGSTAAALVSDALPIHFDVTVDGNTVVSPEVLDTEQFVPSDFGYTSGGFQIVPTFHFLVNVNYYDETQGKYILTNSDIEVKSGSHSDFNEPVSAETKVIEIRDFADSVYTVTVTKTGFDTWSNTYTNSEMKAFANLPLTVVLNKSTIQPLFRTLTDGFNRIQLMLEGENNSIYVAAETNALGGRHVGLKQIDSNGDVQWTKVYGEANRNTYGNNLIQLNGAMLIVGSRPTVSGGSTNAWAIKVNLNGDIVWEKDFTDGFNIKDAVELPSGDIVFVGHNGNRLIRTNSLGNEITNISLTMPSHVNNILLINNTLIISDDIGTIISTDYDGNVNWTVNLLNNGYLHKLVKLSETEFGTIQESNYKSYYNRLNTSGSLLVNNKELSFNDNMKDMILASNGSLMLVSTHYIHKMDFDGDIEWSKEIATGQTRYFYSLFETEEKAVWLGGRNAQSQSVYAKTNLDGIQ